MVYRDFIKRAIAEDSRNRFTEGANVSIVPAQMIAFYQECNPSDVEINYPNLGALCFCPIERLHTLQEEYDYSPDNFVFATCNGDPVFLKDGKVCISLHGVYRPEQLADSFEKFIANYVSS